MRAVARRLTPSASAVMIRHPGLTGQDRQQLWCQATAVEERAAALGKVLAAHRAAQLPLLSALRPTPVVGVTVGDNVA
jgi:hypothetical protein